MQQKERTNYIYFGKCPVFNCTTFLPSSIFELCTSLFGVKTLFDDLKHDLLQNAKGPSRGARYLSTLNALFIRKKSD